MYPGKRKLVPAQYGDQICHNYLALFKSFFGVENATQAKTVTSALAIADTPVQKLRPMQMVPHLDTPHNNQFAVVHYLCSAEHGGTSFYRHRKTSYEVITQARLFNYGTQLKKEAIASKLHESPRYMNGSDHMFEQIHLVEAKFNRAIIYPSNLLHSGNINLDMGLPGDPKVGRLTVGSFILVE